MQHNKKPVAIALNDNDNRLQNDQKFQVKSTSACLKPSHTSAAATT